VAALALCAMLAAGCRPTAPQDDRTHLEFWTLSLKPTYTPYVDGLRSEYERENPGTAVAWLDLPEKVLMQKLLAVLAGGGTPPDLVNLGGGEATTLAQNNAILATDDLVDEATRRQYFPQLWNAVRWNDKSFAIPWYVSVRVLMYNKSLFRAAGLDAAKPPQSWDDMESVARAVRKTGNYGFLPVIRILEDWQMDGLPILDVSRTHARFATPEHAARLAWYARLYQEDLIPPETLTGKYSEAVRRYKSGTLAVLDSGPQFLLTIRQDAPDIYAVTGVAPLWRGKANIEPASVMYFVVPRASAHPREAARLGTWLTNAANQLAFCKLVPLLPSTVEAAKDPFFQHGHGTQPLDDEAIRISIAQLPYARDMTLGVPHAEKLGQVLEDAVERTIYGEPGHRRTREQLAQDALTNLQRAQAEWNRLLSEP
jgi:putative chitobiose transport system substrate-binding protein